MTTTDLDAIYAAILAKPAEDVPRLMYADELDAIGGKQNAAHAKLIRISIARHNADGPFWFSNTPNANYAESQWATKVLLRNWSSYLKRPPLMMDSWQGTREVAIKLQPCSQQLRGFHVIRVWDPIGHWQPLVDRYCYTFFRRGFFSAVKCHWSHWNRYGDQMVMHDPIARVELTTLPDNVGFPLDAFDKHHSDICAKTFRHEFRIAFLRTRWPTVAEWAIPEEPSSP